VGGKHGKGKGPRKNANTVPVQGGNRVKKSARASCYPARICGSKQASDPAQKHGLTSKSAQERSQDTLSRKRSPKQDVTARSDGGYEHPQGYDPAGPHADRHTKALEIPDLRSQEDWYATRAALIVGIGISGNDGISSLAQVTDATAAPKDGTRRGTNAQPHQLLHRKERRKAVSTRDEHHLALNMGRRCKSTTSQMKRLDGRTRNLLGDKCLLGSKCPASSRDQPRRKHPWGSVGGWNVPRTSCWTHSHPLPNNPSS
jgi:hypothetical protein